MSALPAFGYEMTAAEYHERPELSSTNIRQLLNNPYEYAAQIKKEPTEIMKLGAAFHCLILEPNQFTQQYAVEPVADGRTNAGKMIKMTFAAQSEGKTILTAKQKESLDEITAALTASPAISLLRGGQAECSVFGEVINAQGEKYKARARLDYLVNDVIVDLKLSHDASPDGFTKSAANLGYYVQAAWYMDVCRSVGFEPKEFVFCAVEPNPPYMTGIYELDYSWLEFGRSEYRRALEIFDRLEYYQVPVFKDSRTGEILQTLSPPSWLFYRRNASY